MVKIVYPDTKKETLNFLPGQYSRVVNWLKSAYPEGRIISDDNFLEGL